ncbi:rRNA maturation RNase YbeY [Candidatus Bandiella euplotis]|uniref:Endoribonuclease YbeY n=1 Tax=Candidatus Bandiella euplotis TaxID=1664265 RepID=A0ABZ0UMP5_9RICK|nr:rRNA maturation RNase YbeY [Candidatus Bandiella woodruffii]WPX95953.1 Endoribonuclease YbeY [Candidatus Bandiella woodruffii]
MIESESEPMLDECPKLIGVDISVGSSMWASLDFDVHEHCHKVVGAAVSYVLNDHNQKSFIEVSLLLANDEHLHDLNKQYRNKDETTNVLSFPFTDASTDELAHMAESGKQLFLGDVAISYERVAQESLQQEKPFIEYFTYILLHGVLHLLGYDHVKEDEAKLMEKTETKIMKSLGFNNHIVGITENLWF